MHKLHISQPIKQDKFGSKGLKSLVKEVCFGILAYNQTYHRNLREAGKDVPENHLRCNYNGWNFGKVFALSVPENL